MQKREPQTIVGYYTLSNTSVKKADFSIKERKALSYPATPAAIIGYLGVDERFKRQGLGVYTLRKALRRCLDASQVCGCAVVVLDVETKNTIALDMYGKAGFKAFREPEGQVPDPGRPETRKLYMTMPNVKVSAEKGLL